MALAWIGPAPKLQLFGDDGNPLSGGKVYTYEAGTLTPLATYADAEQSAANENPVELDAAGRASIFWGNSPYDVVVTDENDVQLYTVSSFTIPGGGGSSGSGGGFGADTTVASATTVDLGGITSHLATVTGTTPTTSFGSSASTDAPIYLVKAQSAGWVITLGASILCPFVTDQITSTQNDYYWLEYLGSGIWKIFQINRGDGSLDATSLTVANLTVTNSADLP